MSEMLLILAAARLKMTSSSPVSYLGEEAKVQEHQSALAADPVLVCVLHGGELISYRTPGDRYIHTLGDESGFRRKLAQLGIDPTAELRSTTP